MRRVPPLIALLAVLAFAPAADAFTVTPSAAAAPTPLLSARAEQYKRNDAAKVSRDDVSRFLPLYRRAARRYDVPWLLLAAIHKQETAFSTAGGTYHGLNWVGCCAGPMQFNVTNGPQTTWDRYKDAYRRAERPPSYPNPTAGHPSVYDDFDAIMAAASLLSYQGAGMTLDGTAWQAAYDYYGHDLDGVAYADEVLARAIGWSQQGFSINTPVDPSLRDAVEAAWGAPARAALAPPEPEKPEKPRKKRKDR
jgi:hypothetical protein